MERPRKHPKQDKPRIEAGTGKSEERKVAIEGEVDKLCGTLVEGISSLNKKVADANAMFSDTMKEAHETVDMVVQQGNTLKGALAKLRASIGVNTNYPPSEDGVKPGT